jgi:hypothetical protein
MRRAHRSSPPQWPCQVEQRERKKNRQRAASQPRQSESDHHTSLQHPTTPAPSRIELDSRLGIERGQGQERFSMKTDWLTIITESMASAEDPECPSRAAAKPGATALDLAQLESACGMKVPEPLRELLIQSNGIMEETDFGSGFEENYWIIEPTDEIPARFDALRPENEVDDRHAAAAGLFFFGGPGTDGVCFGFGDGVRYAKDAVVAYAPIGREVTLMAPDLRTFLQGWLSERLVVDGW